MFLANWTVLDDQSWSASKDTLIRVLYSGFWGAWMLGLAVTQALAGAIDCGDPMGVQGVLGKPGMERGWTRRQEETRES